MLVCNLDEKSACCWIYKRIYNLLVADSDGTCDNGGNELPETELGDDDDLILW